MKIVVLNGSPKGEQSVTMQYVKYIQKNFTKDEFKILNITKDIRKLENKPEDFSHIISEISGSDGILWAFPVYYFMVPSQLKRFIELIFESGSQAAFDGKYTAVLTTSVHFYDITARNYLNAVCDDLNMRYAGDFLAEMDDLLKPENQKQLLLFAQNFLETINNNTFTEKKYAHVSAKAITYIPSALPQTEKASSRTVVILTDNSSPSTNLGKMTEVLKSLLPYNSTVVNLNELDMKGGCLGCMHCGYDNTCVYKDGVKPLITDTLSKADVIIFAGTIKDRYLSSRWKMYFDRTFVFGHSPVLKDKPVGFLISGPLREIPNLRQIFEAYSNNFAGSVGIITDEYATSEEITALLTSFSQKLSWQLENSYSAPKDFLGVSLHLIFRDLIYKTRSIFRADHIFYKKHKYYDYPYKNIKLRIQNVIMSLLFKIPKIRSEIQKNIGSHMISSFKKILEG